MKWLTLHNPVGDRILFHLPTGLIVDTDPKYKETRIRRNAEFRIKETLAEVVAIIEEAQDGRGKTKT